MYITPQTDIRLLSGISIDPNYNDTIYFDSPSSRASYFLSKTRKNLNGYSYQRYAKNILRVQILADEIYGVDYMMFRNSAYGDKWFYAFVDKVEYINDVTTEIYYHIDDIQTWADKWILKECFIERTHTIRDRVGDSITPEPVEVGEYVYNDYTRVPHFKFGGTDSIIIIAVTDLTGVFPTADTGGKLYEGIYSGLTLLAYSTDNDHWETVTGIINAFVDDGHPDSIISMYMCPKDMIDDDYINTNVPIPSGTYPEIKMHSFGTCGETVNGHIVRNKKLLTYPYNFVNVNNSDGSNLAMRYEFFENGTAILGMYGTYTQPVQVVGFPLNYKKTDTTAYDDVYLDERITLYNYPLCSWTYDAWKAWIAQNSLPMIINAAAAAGSLALAAYTPATTTASSIIGAGGQALETTTPGSFNFSTNASIYGLHQISNILTNMYKASIQADPIKGNISGANAMQANQAYQLWGGRMSVTRQQAEVIDSFFDRFGYAVNKIDYPRLHNRKEHTYIKTINCSIGGDIPADSKRNIENIFDNGITFWANPENVGNYGAPNEPFLQ